MSILGLAWRAFGAVTTAAAIYNISKNVLSKRKMKSVIKTVK